MNNAFEVVMANPLELKQHPRYTLYNQAPEEGTPSDTPSRQEVGASAWESTYKRVKADIERYGGIREPLRVQSGTQVILCGHKRCRIAIELGFEMVPVIYEALDDDAAVDLMVSDNFSRAYEERSPIRRARIYQKAKEMYGFPHGGNRRASYNDGNWKKISEIAMMCGTKQARFMDHLRLLKLIVSMQQLVDQEVISVRGGSILAGLPRDAQKQFAKSVRGIEIDIPDRQIQVFRDTWDEENPNRRAELDHLAKVTDADDPEDDDSFDGLSDQNEVEDWTIGFEGAGGEDEATAKLDRSFDSTSLPDESNEPVVRIERVDIRQQRNGSSPDVQSIEEQRHELVDRMGNTFSEDGKRKLEWMAFKKMMQSQIRSIRRWEKDFDASMTPDVAERCRINKDTETELYRFKRELEHYLVAVRKVVPEAEPITADTEIGPFVDDALAEERPAR
ncbi:MAG: ParB/RepB/Spo0J family partition protein [Bacilli bacterium]